MLAINQIEQSSPNNPCSTVMRDTDICKAQSYYFCQILLCYLL